MFTNKLLMQSITETDPSHQTPTFNKHQEIAVEKLETLSKQLYDNETTIEKQIQQNGSENENQVEAQSESERQEGNEGSEFQVLKNQMMKIQLIAATQIKVLKEELEKKNAFIQQLQAKLANCQQKQKEEIGIMTEEDSRDEQIRVLKQGLVRHVRINRQLTSKLVSSGKPPKGKKEKKGQEIQELVKNVSL